MDVGIEFVYGVPVIVAVVAFLKYAVPPLKSRSWLLPWVTLVVSEGLALLAVAGPPKEVLLKGLMAALVASGVYSQTKAGVVDPIRDAGGVPSA